MRTSPEAREYGRAPWRSWLEGRREGSLGSTAGADAVYTLRSVSYSTLKHSYIIWSASVIDNHTAVVCLYVYKSIFVSIILIVNLY